MDRRKLLPLAARVLVASAVFASFLVSGSALAEPPAAIAPQGHERVRATFERFASTWMDKIRRLETQQRESPTIRPGAGGLLVTYRGYGDAFKTELRSTGHPSAPYVGILRYSEHLYSCQSVEATKCTVASTVPVTEIFRFEDGRWVY